VSANSEAIYKLRGSVQFLLERDPKSLTAIICRYKKEAEKIFKVLRKLPKVRLQTNLLSFEPGIVVVNVHQVKGLEFPGVILWNPSGRNYPATANGKNLLYVAITRASKRLAIFYYEPLTSLLS
jgi:DNA helicase II / ATP-dependent DNA helicase PcrA